MLNKLIKNIFSINSEGIHKTIKILGIKIKLKNTKLEMREQIDSKQAIISEQQNIINHVEKVLNERIELIDNLQLTIAEKELDLQKKNIWSSAQQGENVQKINNLKNKYQGERCFIIGGSPSLSQLDLSKLENEFTFTVGRGYNLKSIGLKKSNFHVMSDYLGYLECFKEIDENFSDIYFTSSDVPFVNKVKEHIIFDFAPLGNNKYKIQEDLTKTLIAGQTVICFALNIAYYLGFKEIIFIGVDLDFENTSGHAYKENDGEAERQKSHSRVCQDIMLECLTSGTKQLQENGLKLYNASPAGRLDCMPRVKYEEILSNAKARRD